MDDPIRDIEIRFNALEFLIRGLLAHYLAAMPQDQADNLANVLMAQARLWTRSPGAPIRDTEDIEKEVAETWVWVIAQIERARAIEQELRKSQSKGTNGS
jgi:hypothetical protein